MTASQHKVLIVGNQRVRDVSLLPSDLDRLSAMADWEWLHLEGGVEFGPNEDPDAIRQLIEHVRDVDCVVVSHGSPMISADVMDGAPNLKIIGEMEGDRFAYRIDVESAWLRPLLTPATVGMIGRRELDMIPSNSVFVNVSRGAVVDSDALIARLKRRTCRADDALISSRGWTCSTRSRFHRTVRLSGSPTPS